MKRSNKTIDDASNTKELFSKPITKDAYDTTTSFATATYNSYTKDVTYNTTDKLITTEYIDPSFIYVGKNTGDFYNPLYSPTIAPKGSSPLTWKTVDDTPMHYSEGGESGFNKSNQKSERIKKLDDYKKEFVTKVRTWIRESSEYQNASLKDIENLYFNFSKLDNYLLDIQKEIENENDT